MIRLIRFNLEFEHFERWFNAELALVMLDFNSSIRKAYSATFSILLMCFVFAQSGQTQNLVLNGGFEEYDTCPDNGGQLNRAKPWIALPSKEVELFNSCSSNPFFKTPLMLNSRLIYPRNGAGMSGFFVLREYGWNYREYLHQKLKNRLTKNGVYYVEFFVLTTSNCKYNIKNVSLNFSNDSVVPFTNVKLLSLKENITNQKIYLTDTLNWMKISGYYLSNGGEQFITIGNFRADENTELVINNYGHNSVVEFFIDDVSVIPIDSIEGGIPANAGPDQTIFTNDSVFIGQNMSGNFCQWYRNGTLITPAAFGFYDKPTMVVNEYVVVQNLGGVIDRDTAYIYVKDACLKPIERQLKQIAPNSSTGKFSLQFRTNLTDQLPYFITDLSGKIVKEASLDINQGKAELELVDANGVYFLQVKGEVHKLIIQK